MPPTLDAKPIVELSSGAQADLQMLSGTLLGIRGALYQELDNALPDAIIDRQSKSPAHTRVGSISERLVAINSLNKQISTLLGTDDPLPLAPKALSPEKTQATLDALVNWHTTYPALKGLTGVSEIEKVLGPSDPTPEVRQELLDRKRTVDAAVAAGKKK
jgi:hypothetical protein